MKSHNCILACFRIFTSAQCAAFAAPATFVAAVRGFRRTDPCKLDFAAFRRGVEDFVNSER